METTIQTTQETIITAQAENRKSEYGVAQICFGAVMAVGALYGMWAMVSLMFSMFMN